MLTQSAQNLPAEQLQNILKQLSSEGITMVLAFAQSVLEDEQDTQDLVNDALKLSEPSLASAWNDLPDEP